MKSISASSTVVQEYLEQFGFPFQIKHYPASTRTAKEAAEAIGCEVGQIAKSLIFKDQTTHQAVLIIASGINLVSLEKVEQSTGFKLGKADANFVREQTGFAIGGVPPVAHKQSITTLLDTDLQNYQQIWAAAGTPNTVFELTPSSLEKLTTGQWLDLSQ